MKPLIDGIHTCVLAKDAISHVNAGEAIELIIIPANQQATYIGRSIDKNGNIVVKLKVTTHAS
jgi:hypothetical protein